MKGRLMDYLSRVARWATVVSLAWLTGCATGPAFVAPEAPLAERAAVYVYRQFAIGGAAISHAVTIDGAPAGVLRNGAYLRSVAVAELPISLRVDKCAPLPNGLRVRAGEIAYVEARLISGSVEFGGRYYFDYRCELVRRTEAEALPALTALRRAE